MLSKLTKPAEIDDSQLKKKIMDQYGFVDKVRLKLIEAKLLFKWAFQSRTH